MKASDVLIRKLKSMEGFSSKAYFDRTGKVWTIGYGHTGNVKAGDAISEYQGEQLLMEDLKRFEAHADKVRGLNTQGKYDAVVDFCYNCGIENFDKSTLRKYIESGRKDWEIQEQILRWVTSGGVKLGGLVSRRIWEANRWCEK